MSTRIKSLNWKSAAIWGIKLRISDSKSTWKVIHSVLKPNSKKKNETSLEINGEATSNPEAVANKFNEYFSSVAANLDEKIPTANVAP